MKQFGDVVNDVDQSAAQSDCAASLPPPPGDDWRPLEDYPPAPGSPRYQPFAQRMMVASPSGKATARRCPLPGSTAHGHGQRAALRPALPPASAGDEEAAPAHTVGATCDGMTASDEQHDPSMQSEAAIQRLGSFGPWYERTLAAMTNLQQLGSGPLGTDRSTAGGRADCSRKADARLYGQASAKDDRNGLAQMLLPSPTSVVAFKGARLLDFVRSREWLITSSKPCLGGKPHRLRATRAAAVDSQR